MAGGQVIAAVKARLAGFSGAPLHLPNELAPTMHPFVAVQFPVATETQISFGAPGENLFREEGAIRFVIVVRPGSGTHRLGAIAETLRDLFRNARFDGVRCAAPSTPVFDDRSNAAGLFRAAFIVPYEFDSFA